MMTLRGFSDCAIKRHFYPPHEEWQILEHSMKELKLDMTGQAEILISRDEAEDLSRLLRHFADHGTLPAPMQQKPSLIMHECRRCKKAKPTN